MMVDLVEQLHVDLVRYGKRHHIILNWSGEIHFLVERQDMLWKSKGWDDCPSEHSGEDRASEGPSNSCKRSEASRH